ncbi:MAG: VOC family protein [Acidimicrobiia bacterium]|jgi:catechol 2,3-dioxygenase-like lactoylglutathione lyase family enzyme
MPALDALGLVVADMPATLAFYRRLGLEIPAGADAEEHVEVAVAGGLRLMFDTVELVRSFSEWEPASGGHRVALAFLCVSPAEVDATHDALVADGHRSHLAPFDAFWGQRYATVLDPDGNPVDLFAPLG